MNAAQQPIPWPMLINLHVQEDALKDILTTCVEGGSSYWLQADDIERDSSLNVVKIVNCHDVTGEMPEGKDTWGDATLATIHVGMQRIINGSVKVSEFIRQAVFMLAVDPDNANWDAETADCILQAGLLNDITFG